MCHLHKNFDKLSNDHFVASARPWYRALYITFELLMIVLFAHQTIRIVTYDRIEVGSVPQLDIYFSILGKAWQTSMITGMYLTTESSDCADPAFVRTWAGAKA